MAMVAIGILLLVLGIVGHIRFMLDLRAEHGRLVAIRLLPSDHFPFSVTLAAAVLVLLLGLFAITSIVAHIGPFS